LFSNFKYHFLFVSIRLIHTLKTSSAPLKTSSAPFDLLMLPLVAIMLAKGESGHGVRFSFDLTAWVQFLPSPGHEVWLLSTAVVREMLWSSFHTESTAAVRESEMGLVGFGTTILFRPLFYFDRL
jgi:hypothetical protein